jgi:hypothetical protein
MQLSTPISWTEANQFLLAAEFTRLKERVGAKSCADAGLASDEAAAEEVRRSMKSPAALERLAELFELSPFEREILLLAAGVEMDSELATHCPRVTFGLAMAALREPHWSALTPSRPLRRFRLIELERGHGLTSAPLRIDERILHYLAGVNFPDPRLEPILKASTFPDCVAAEHQATAARAARVLQTGLQTPLQLCGDDSQGQEDTAALIASQAGLHLFTARAEELPLPGQELDQFTLLWERDALMLPAALLIACGGAGLTPSARHVAERLPGVVILGLQDSVHLSRSSLRFEVNKPQPAEQRRLWRNALGEAAASLNGALDGISEQFRLSARAIRSTGALAIPADGELDARDLWNVCRSLSRPRLENLAQRLVTSAAWEDLVLPETQMQTLQYLAAQVRHRMKVYETWGFSAKGRRGLGVSALFTGESGTGKTLAAEVLANELALDLYRIDLIGETEKNLKQVFDAAEEGGALLLFDEADALFGKRGDVKDSHDRYANIEVGYLLQRMESYQGLAILTTNMKSALDKAFQRRLRFTIHFPFPDATQREAIWKRVFPAGTPTQGFDASKLAQLKVAGGNIRNIALNAAFLAAAADTPVGMEHLLQAAGLEAQKIERPLSTTEVRGWV